MPATMRPSELHEVAEKLTRQPLPPGGRSHSDRMHVSDRLGLREKAKQIRDDLPSVANDERRVSKLVNEEWMVQVTGVTRTPEFMQLIENLVVVLVGAHRNFCGTAHRRSAAIVTARMPVDESLAFGSVPEGRPLPSRISIPRQRRFCDQRGRRFTSRPAASRPRPWSSRR